MKKLPPKANLDHLKKQAKSCCASTATATQQRSLASSIIFPPPRTARIVK